VTLEATREGWRASFDNAPGPRSQVSLELTYDSRDAPTSTLLGLDPMPFPWAARVSIMSATGLTG
jgi:hypothetical protein